MKWWRMAMASAGAVLLVASAPTAGSPVAAYDLSSWLPEIRASQDLDGPVVVSGTLMTAAGEPSRGRISLVAWPTQKILSNIKTGDVIKTVPVAKSAAGADGAFEMRIDPSVPLAEFMEGDGIVNFDLVADGPTGVAVFSFPRRLATDGGRTTWLATERATAASESALILDVALDDGPPIGDDPAAPPPPTDKFCVVTNVATWDLRQTIVGEVFTGPVATADLTYTSGSSSTVGVGYSVSGTLGTWSQSGTMSTSSTSTENFPTQFQNNSKQMRTYFGWKDFKTECWDRGAYWASYQAKAYQYQGGQVLVAASAPSATYCLPYPSGSSTSRDSGSAYTFSTGVKLSGVIGIDLSAKTGFNTSTKLTYWFTSAGRLCGTDTYPGSAQRLVAKAP